MFNMCVCVDVTSSASRECGVNFPLTPASSSTRHPIVVSSCSVSLRFVRACPALHSHRDSGGTHTKNIIEMISPCRFVDTTRFENHGYGYAYNIYVYLVVGGDKIAAAAADCPTAVAVNTCENDTRVLSTSFPPTVCAHKTLARMYCIDLMLAKPLALASRFTCCPRACKQMRTSRVYAYV